VPLFPGVLLAMPFLYTADVTPVDGATTSLVQYIVSFGVLGVVAVAFAFGFIVPRKTVDRARDEARGDLLKENERLDAAWKELQGKHAELEEFVRAQLVPAVVQFTAVAQSLIPLLQAQIERSRGSDGR
jgi:hypothetical protein